MNMPQKKTLYEYILYPNKNDFEEKYAKIIFKYILKGFEAIHNIEICHRNITLGNILLDENFRPKICDFHFICECSRKLRGKSGTYQYLSLEIICENFEEYDGKKADIFSLGHLLYLLVKGKLNKEVEKKFIKYKTDFNFEKYLNLLKIQIKNTSKEFQELIISMNDFNPDNRPSIEDIFDFEWMKEVIEDDLNQEKDIYNEFKRSETIMDQNI